MHMKFLAILRLFVLSIFALAPVFANAQESGQSIDEIIAAAEANGTQVIIVNPGGTSEEETDNVQDRLQRGFMMTTQERLAAFRITLGDRLKAAPASLEEVMFILNGQSPTGHWSEYLRIVFWTIAFLILGELIVRETYGKRIVGPWFLRMQRNKPVGYTDKLPVLLLRAILAVVGLILVTIVTYAIGYAVFGESTDGTVRLTVAYVYVTYVTARGIAFLWRMILSPYLGPYRIPRIKGSEARKLYWWLLVVATIAIIVVNFDAWLEELGISYNVHAVITTFSTLFVVFLNVVMVLVNRHAVSDAILDGRPPEEVPVFTRFVSNAWAPAAILYFFVAWAEMTYRLIEELPLGWPLISGFYMILLTVLVVYGMVGYLIERIFRRRRFVMEMQERMAAEAAQQVDASTDRAGEEGGETPPVPEPYQMRTFEDLSRRVANILAICAGIFAILWIWRIDIGMMAMADSEIWFVTEFYNVVVIIFIGYVLYHAARIWIDQKIEEEGGDQVEVAPGDEGGAGGASRLATLLPLFRNFLLVVIFISFTMIALSNMGVNISALFAGAGIVGLAIGFGAQALVRDIFSGAFFLFDDAFRKGEYIDVGSVKGTVEKISVRSFQLRHHLGPLHTIPFGEIQHLTNFSRDWVMMKLPLRVTYDTDVEHVRKLIKKLGLKLMEDEVIGHQFLQPLKSQGVIEMQDSAMIIRVKFMTKPGDQWVLRKRVYQEIRDLFEKEGIKFAHREVTVRIAGDADNLTEKQKEAVGAAALSSMDEDDIAEAMGDDSGDDR